MDAKILKFQPKVCACAINNHRNILTNFITSTTRALLLKSYTTIKDVLVLKPSGFCAHSKKKDTVQNPDSFRFISNRLCLRIRLALALGIKAHA